MDILFTLLTVILGHFTGAYLFYFFHRYIFHGPLGRYPILKRWKAVHTRHHASPNDPGAFFFPWWANAMIWTMAIISALVIPAFGLGMVSFFCLYAYRHKTSHMGSNARYSIHHMNHHINHSVSNFSGPYPAIDMLFGTYRPAPIKIITRSDKS